MLRTLTKQALLTLAAAGLLWQGVSAAADEPTAEENIAILDELSLGDLLSMKITTGSFLELDLKKSPLSMTIITREMVRASGARHMSELLEIYVPGFVYNNNKYVGYVWAMRGVTNDRNTKVIYLVNGHKMNSQARTGASSETSLGLLGDIERVEVLRGPAGLVYGSGAIAGIINVVTRKGGENKSNISVTSAVDGSKTVEATLAGAPEEGKSFSVTGGFKQSDGLPVSTSRIYTRGGGTPDIMGIPSDGRFGSTKGNWKIATDITVDKFNLYMRATRQIDNEAFAFQYTPWADKWGQPSDSASVAGWGTREIDGVNVSPLNPFWRNRNNWRSSRKNYGVDNFMSEASYNFDIGENELKTKIGFDMNTCTIGEELLEHYENDVQYKAGRLIEQFGERRYLANATYLLKNIPQLQAAFGAELRIDDIGNSITGKNEQLWNPDHYIVKDVVYTTTSLYGEGFYDINEMLGVHGGVRLDIHTRAVFASPKLAAVYNPIENHTFKLIYQSAANNGSADNYEYNGNMVDNNGKVVTEPLLVNFPDEPTASSALKPPAELSEMHKLKPERVHSLEGIYVGKLSESFTIEPSVSVNQVNNLFVWEQQLFRVVNAGKYTFANADIALNYSNKYFKIGANHTIQKPILTKEKDQTATFMTYSTRDTVINGDTVYGYIDKITNNDTTYKPYYEKGKKVTINLVKKSITYDGKNFLNLPTNMTKMYATYTPFEWISLNANLRLIWGYPGRAAVVDSFGDTGNYLGYYGEKDAPNFGRYFNTMVSKKLNLSLSFVLPGDLEATLYVYNVLGTDRHNFKKREVDDNTVNTLRLEHMFDYPNRDAYSIDQQTIGITMTKSF